MEHQGGENLTAETMRFSSETHASTSTKPHTHNYGIICLYVSCETMFALNFRTLDRPTKCRFDFVWMSITFVHTHRYHFANCNCKPRKMKKRKMNTTLK